MVASSFGVATDFRQIDLHSIFMGATSTPIIGGNKLYNSWTLSNEPTPNSFANARYFVNYLSVDAEGAITGGTVYFLHINAGIKAGGQTTYLEGFQLGRLRINAADWYDAHLTPSNSDDLALLLGQFAGIDNLGLSRGDDFIWAMAGNDVVHDPGGNDTLYGGDGNDRVFSGFGGDLVYGGNGEDRLVGGFGKDRLIGEGHRDRLHGEDGNDFLRGDSGADILYGGAGDDTLIGGGGNDRMTLGDGADVVRIAAGFVTETLYDITPGVDVIEILAPSGSTVMPDVHYEGGNATVSVLDGTLILLDVAPGSITADSFVLVPL